MKNEKNGTNQQPHKRNMKQIRNTNEQMEKYNI